jgi:hypothetical protein
MTVPKFRIIGRFVRERERGYAESSDEFYNVLQRLEKRLYGSVWIDVECEHVSSCYWIDKATTGHTSFESKLIKRWPQASTIGEFSINPLIKT